MWTRCTAGGGHFRRRHKISADTSPGDSLSNSAVTLRATRTVASLAEPISLQEAVGRLGVHYMTAYRYVRTGRLPAQRDGVQWWIDPRDLDLVQHQERVRPGGPRPKRDRTAALTARRLGPQFARRGRKRGVVIIGAPAGDQHSLPGATASGCDGAVQSTNQAVRRSDSTAARPARPAPRQARTGRQAPAR
jgi:excisionase family DNA binding protein